MYYDALRTFITVVEEKSFTRAGEKLRLSQPSVSLHIKHLETEFQAKLIDRSPKHLYVTTAGKMLYERAKQIVNLYEKTKEDIYAHQHTVTGKLRIGASFTIGEYVLPVLLADFSRRYSEVEVEVTIGNTKRIAEAVKLLQMDIGLIEGQTSDKELRITPFMQDEMVLVVPIAHPLAARGTVTPDELQDETWVVREEGSGTRVYSDYVIRAFGLRVKKMITLSSNQGVKEAVIAGLGITLLSRWVVKKHLQHGELAELSLQSEPFLRRFSYIYPAHAERTRLVEVFLSSLVQKLE
ncbi:MULTISPECIES: LysR family transcriptional regulator [Aneurinibacillus]|uniref:LysR family transcriptional regulator n=1 Tax=Aneurinibacillus thermoaerophilus TaxID=143495 RepID=A0ABX8Y662_ANETH|nr:MULTISPECIES: LysR family transcriptional regulator [Aneurinibacillus]AMA73075.1 LysR family transcriptional regulator [Aneurinibacillus sp. XH2]MED0676567.1 LysR family transcriptional regulator [Aneurinibacillus thermoaerophilus]MED0678547.1 LysR family transcriptional regulator [Aneurinibacillus thermoaerophilus]MED0735934.1 LysR family transcriptional regulator [Aneurinibacillus thermoaerophilus]MED0757110.1 LysR family transcriptional regulator [Aneurinibacillus thermoaerophilus]